MAIEEVGKVQHVDELMSGAISLDGRSDPGVVAILIRDDVRAHLKQFNLGGIDITPEDAERKVRGELEQRHDEQLAADLLTWDRDARATERALEETVAASRRPPAIQNDAHELVLYRRWEGRTLPDVVKAYQATTDADDPVFVRLVESDDVAWTLRLKASDRDVAALQQLQQVIKARQDARQDVGTVARLAALRECRANSLSRLGYLLSEAKARRPLQIARLRSASARTADGQPTLGKH